MKDRNDVLICTGYRHPLAFIMVPFFITCLLGTGIILKFKIVRGVHYLYTPLDAQWKLENRVFQEFWASQDDLYYPGKDVFRRKSVFLLIEAKDGGSVLRPAYASEFMNLLDWLANETFVTSDGIQYTYRNICLHYHRECFQNSHARFIADTFRCGDQVLAAKFL
ncbi:unnamed protein product [Gongylonema pulchrum]|uniref:Patched domain-containing protein 3 n=1 Tax=Gongylonema pulchrum TaxID=637853 RepID=A0A183DQ82_9BILA|nr:unnamed protein product [Gongylonema pulchrum]